MNWIYRLNQWMWWTLDLLYPPACGGCNQAGSHWCPTCQDLVRTPPEPICVHCGLPIHMPGTCKGCQESPPAYASMRSWLVFEGPIRQALHKLKYQRNSSLGHVLARHLFPFLEGLNFPVDVIVPVPLGRERLRERGYNQVAMVAFPLAMLGGWDYKPACLYRSRETASQVGLSIAQRRQNVQDAFHADPRLIDGRDVLLIDDVATTGATISSCSGALLQAGARAVHALTIARALPHHGLNVI